jgi:hypothetical protein
MMLAGDIAARRTSRSRKQYDLREPTRQFLRLDVFFCDISQN